MQQGGEDFGRCTAKSLAGDEYFRKLGIAVLPTQRGEVAVLEISAALTGAGADHDDGGRDLRMAGTDRRPRRFERAKQTGGGEGVGLTRTCHGGWFGGHDRPPARLAQVRSR